MLCRAFAHDPARPYDVAEVTVFFESTPGLHHGERLQELLAAAWNCRLHDVSLYNVYTEHELRDRDADRVTERGADRDTVLLETGFGPDGAHYADPSRTLMLVTPTWVRRLTAAQQRAAAMAETARIGRTVQAQARKPQAAAAMASVASLGELSDAGQCVLQRLATAPDHTADFDDLAGAILGCSGADETLLRRTLSALNQAGLIRWRLHSARATAAGLQVAAGQTVAADQREGVAA